MATVEFVARDRVGIVTIDRVERRNALNAQLCEQMTAHLWGHRGLRAIVVTGAGTAFCAGADLATRFAEGDTADGAMDTFRPTFEILLDAIVDHPAPVIAAINGPAMGAGMQLAVACDLRVATPKARMAIPGGKLGILLSPANIARLAQLVGHGLARDFLLAGREVDGEEAQRVGLVQRVADDALAAALALADDIAALAPLSVQGHKRALNLVASGPLTDASRAEIAALETTAFASADLREGMAAFAEKRAPVFRGE
jgi:enoyl-CoA hydratase